MLVTYFDEVKPNAPIQPYYLLGGLAIDESMIPILEQETNVLATKCFGKGSGISKSTEFHATDIASGNGRFKKVRDPKKRFQLLKMLIKIYDKPEGVYRIAVGIRPDNLYSPKDPEELALMYFIERVNQLCKSKSTRTLLIGDFEKEKIVTKSVQNLDYYKSDGTPYAFGQDIKQVIDTVHFAHSHNSRMLQLADTYMWCLQLRHQSIKQSELRKNLIDFIKDETDTSWEHKFKYWPEKS